MLESADVIDLPVMRSCGFEIGPNEPDRNWIGSTEIGWKSYEVRRLEANRQQLKQKTH
jgi:hypothetical protein